MRKLNKNDLFEKIADSTHVSKRDVREVLDKTFDIIENSILKGEEVNITNFGVFTPKKRVAREGTHPKTHKRMMIKSANTVIFRASKTLKAKLNK